MDKCPTCGAETRPGDNFCLQCGNRLVPSVAPTQQAQPAMGAMGNIGGDTAMATLAADEWAPPAPFSQPGADPWASPAPPVPPTVQSNPWDASLLTVASTSSEPPTVRSDSPQPAVPAVMEKIDDPARLILRSDSGEIVQEFVLDRPEMSIGRAPQSDILLSKDKLISRRHATVTYHFGACKQRLVLFELHP
jgi:hypothetical protein